MERTSSARIRRATETSGGVSWLRLALVLLLVWWTIRLGFGLTRWCFIDWVNLPFHEAGHVFLRPLGTTMHYLGGTIGQLLVPGLLVWYFLKRMPNPFAAAICAWWFGENLINISIYMADARDLKLPLVGGGYHDWNHLFYAFGLLDEGSVVTISGITRGLGTLAMLLGLAWCAYFVLDAGRQQRVRYWLEERAPRLGLLLE